MTQYHVWTSAEMDLGCPSPKMDPGCPVLPFKLQTLCQIEISLSLSIYIYILLIQLINKEDQHLNEAEPHLLNLEKFPEPCERTQLIESHLACNRCAMKMWSSLGSLPLLGTSSQPCPNILGILCHMQCLCQPQSRYFVGIEHTRKVLYYWACV